MEDKQKKEAIKDKSVDDSKKQLNIELLKKEKSEMISKYKEQFNLRFKKNIDNLNSTQLDKLLTRTNEMIVKNSHKEALLLQLLSFRELIEDKMSNN
ncbi:MAG: hypothetical protein Q8S84_05005 [bacterium]|nr:hypothetical protein [bacterium]